MSDQCDRPPEGWRCTRAKGHDGPCAAVPVTREHGEDKPDMTSLDAAISIANEISEKTGCYALNSGTLGTVVAIAERTIDKLVADHAEHVLELRGQIEVAEAARDAARESEARLRDAIVEFRSHAMYPFPDCSTEKKLAFIAASKRLDAALTGAAATPETKL